jgi:hypothetical protein
MDADAIERRAVLLRNT